MATTTTVPTVTDALLTLLSQELSPVPVFEAWPGREGQAVMVNLGEVTWPEYDIATIKAGRKQRQEKYEIAFEVWNLDTAETSPANCKPVRDRTFEVLEGIENALADDVTAGAGFGVVQWIVSRFDDAGPRKFERGWGYLISGAFVVNARLL